MQIDIQLNQKLKLQITHFLVAVCYGSIECGESQRTHDKGDELTQNMERELTNAFHGDLSNGITSFVDNFCDMRGPLFERLVEKGYATEGEDKMIRLDTHKLFKYAKGESLLLDDKMKVSLHLSSLNGKTLIKSGTLMNYKRSIFDVMKKYQKYLYDFCGNHEEDLPSGKNVDDLFEFLWEKMYFDETNGGVDDESDELSEESVQNNGNKQAMMQKFPKNWIPKCWLTFYLLVSKHSRVVDSLLHIFTYTGKSVDTLSTRSRKQERKDKLQRKDEKRKYEMFNSNRGVNLEEKQMEVNLGLRRSRQGRDEFIRNIEILQVEINDLRQEKSENFRLLGQMYQGNPSGMRNDDIKLIEFNSFLLN